MDADLEGNKTKILRDKEVYPPPPPPPWIIFFGGGGGGYTHEIDFSLFCHLIFKM